MAVPLPFGALGLSEGVADQLFKLVGHPSGCLAMMGFRVVMYGGALVGAIVYLAKLKEVRGLTASAHQIEEEMIEGDLDETGRRASRDRISCRVGSIVLIRLLRYLSPMPDRDDPDRLLADLVEEAIGLDVHFPVGQLGKFRRRRPPNWETARAV